MKEDRVKERDYHPPQWFYSAIYIFFFVMGLVFVLSPWIANWGECININPWWHCLRSVVR